MPNLWGHPYDFFADESVTVGAASTALTAATFTPTTALGPAQFALITVETDQVRIRFTGDAAAAGATHLLNVGDSAELHGLQNIRNFRAIRVTGDATLRVSYGRPRR